MSTVVYCRDTATSRRKGQDTPNTYRRKIARTIGDGSIISGPKTAIIPHSAALPAHFLPLASRGASKRVTTVRGQQQARIAGCRGIKRKRDLGNARTTTISRHALCFLEFLGQTCIIQNDARLMIPDERTDLLPRFNTAARTKRG